MEQNKQQEFISGIWSSSFLVNFIDPTITSTLSWHCFTSMFPPVKLLIPDILPFFDQLPTLKNSEHMTPMITISNGNYHMEILTTVIHLTYDLENKRRCRN